MKASVSVFERMAQTALVIQRVLKESILSKSNLNVFSSKKLNHSNLLEVESEKCLFNHF